MNSNKKLFFVVCITSLVVLACVALGFSYSYVYTSTAKNNAVLISTGNLNTTVTYTSMGNLTLVPTTDANGLASTTKSVITITKNNNLSAVYRLQIGYATSNLPSGKTSGDLMPPDYIKLAVYTCNADGSNLSANPVAGPMYLSDLTVAKYTSDSIYNFRYFLFEDYVTGNTSKSYAIKVWLDYYTYRTYNGKIIPLGVDVDVQPVSNYNKYTISGTIVNSSGTAVEGAKISFNHSNQRAATTTSDGTFSITSYNLYDGLYPVTITYSNQEYEGIIKLQTGDASFSSNALQFTNGYFVTRAYSYNSTARFIKNYNSISDSVSSLSNYSSTYSVPVSYVITSPDSLGTTAISGLTFTLPSSGKAFTVTGS